jgi:protein phosphatase
MPAPSRRRRALKWAAAVAVVAAVVVAAVLFVRSIYFLGTDSQGNVAVYRGLPYELPFGVSLYSRQYSIPVQEGALSEDRQRAVTGHTLRGKDDATSLAQDIQNRPTEGVPQPPPPPAQPKKNKKSGASSKDKQAQKR